MVGGGGAKATKGLVEPKTTGAPVLLRAFLKGSEVKNKPLCSRISRKFEAESLAFDVYTMQKTIWTIRCQLSLREQIDADTTVKINLFSYVGLHCCNLSDKTVRNCLTTFILFLPCVLFSCGMLVA